MWFHYDLPGDVLYLRLWSHRDRPIVGEETDRGLLLRDNGSDEPVGFMIINWWQNFGEGALPESYRETAFVRSRTNWG